MPNPLPDRVAPLLDDTARLAALLEVELALSAVAAEVGATDETDADGVERAVAAVYGTDPAELGGDHGDPVDSLVGRLRAAARRIQPGAERAVHPGAGGPDVRDTAFALLVRRAGARIGTDLRAAADTAAGLAARHRDTPAAHPSGPTTAGLLAASWCDGLDRARVRLAATLDALPVQYGGPAGTLAAVHPHGPAVADALAARLGLAAQGVPWPAERTRLGELAGALGVAAGACATTAADLARRPATVWAGADPSGADPSGADPAGVLASARDAPGLVAAVLAAGAGADPGPPVRAVSGIPGGPEWEALVGLVRATAGAASGLRACLAGLRVHPTGASGNVGHAPELVDRVLAGEAPMTPLDLITRYYDGCSAGDVEAMRSTLHPDVVHWFLAPNPGSAPVAGAEHLARYWRKVQARIDARWVVDHALCGPLDGGAGEAVIEWTMFWRPVGTGDRIATRGAEWFVFDGGLIREIRSYYQQRETTTELDGFGYAGRGWSVPGTERSRLHPLMGACPDGAGLLGSSAMPSPLLDPSVPSHTHAACRLAAAPILWLTTVGADARPHSVPVWFLWADPRLVVFSRPDTAKVDRLRHNAAVCVSLDSAVGGGDIVLAEGDAELAGAGAVAGDLEGFERKYRTMFGGQSMAQWQELFSQPIVVTVRRIVSWTATPQGLDYVTVPS